MQRHAWAIIAVLLASTPLLAQTMPSSDQLRPAELKPVYDRLEQIDQAIKKIDEKLTRLVESNASAAQKELAEMRELVKSLRQEVADIAHRVPKEPTVTRKATTENRGGTVLLVNEHPVYMMETLVNGERYQVPPGGNQSVAVPIGALTLQVLQTDQVMRTRTIQAGETKLITMR